MSASLCEVLEDLAARTERRAANPAYGWRPVELAELQGLAEGYRSAARVARAGSSGAPSAAEAEVVPELNALLSAAWIAGERFSASLVMLAERGGRADGWLSARDEAAAVRRAWEGLRRALDAAGL